MTQNSSLKSSRLIVLAAVCVAVAALYFARDVLIPLALAVLVSFLVAPLVSRLERAGVPRVPSVILVVCVLLTIVAAIGWVVYVQVIDLADQLPRYKDDIIGKVRSIVGGEPGAIGKAAEAIKDVTAAVSAPATQAAPAAATTSPAENDVLARILQTMESRAPPSVPTIDNPVPVRVLRDESSPIQLLSGWLGSVAGTLGIAGIVLVFVVFMLLQREDMRDRLIRLVGYGQLNVTTQAFDDAASRISRFLLAQSIVNGTYGVAIAIGLWLIGYLVGGDVFPNFVLWGLLCAVLRFIPYLGPWIAAAFPLALAFAVYPGYAVFITAAVMFIVVELLSNNVLEPLLYGSSTGMSTLAVLVSAVFWTWLWGPIGLVMATPLTVCLVVIGKYVPSLKFFDILLGDEPVLSLPERVYQRLLAGDPEEALELVEELSKTKSADDIFDTVLLPALAMAEQDRHGGRLDDARAQTIRDAMRELIEELPVEHEAPAPAPAADAVSVVLLPAHDDADEIVAIMLAKLLQSRGVRAVPVSQNSLASEMIQQVEQSSADIVCVSALPPAAQTHARYLCKRLHARFPDIDTVVGLWTVRGDLHKLRQRIMCSGSVTFASALAQAVAQIHELAQPKMAQSTSQPITPGPPTSRSTSASRS